MEKRDLALAISDQSNFSPNYRGKLRNQSPSLYYHPSITLSRLCLSIAVASAVLITVSFGTETFAPLTFAKGEKVALGGGSFGDALAQEGTL